MNHFHAVTNPNAMFPSLVLCKKCYSTYKHAQFRSHECNKKKRCFACKRYECDRQQGVKGIDCSDCNLLFANKGCFDAHKESQKKGNSLCQTRKKCKTCYKIIYSSTQPFDEHKCHTYKCYNCSEWVERDHLCYLRIRKPKLTSGKFIFFDFESTTDSIFQCENDYEPSNKTGCGSVLSEGETDTCKEGDLCKTCRKCKNCDKTICGRPQHQPNLAVAESACDQCKNEVLLKDSTCRNCGDVCDECFSGKAENETNCTNTSCGLRRRVFKGLDTLHLFSSWLFTPKHKNYVVLAHNSKAYDSSFLLHWLITEACLTPQIIYSGSKIMSLAIKDNLNITCIDSINFMMMALKHLPKAFGLKPEEVGLEEGSDVQEVAKLPFPHRFNTRENWNYNSDFPPLHMYDVEYLSEEEREKMTAWHAKQAGKIFNMQEQLEYYCTIDCSILRLSCMKFRDLIISMTKDESQSGDTSYVDCFAHITLASTVMQIYRLKHMFEVYQVELSDGRTGEATLTGGKWTMSGEDLPEGEIVQKQFLHSSLTQIPSAGYVVQSNHSNKSIQYMEYMSNKLGRQIIHARNAGEHCIRTNGHRYKVDGYDPHAPEGPTVHSYLGCIFHGHSCLENRNFTKHPRTNFTLKEMHEQTLAREKDIKEAGYIVKSIYECQFDKMIKENEGIRKFVNELDIPQRMKIREAFYGGRTSVFKLHCEADTEAGEEIHYLDFCSLYPYINKTGRLPLKHPEIITRDFDMTMKSYFGIAHVKILPPRDNYFGVLPHRARGKLHFPLCQKCCDTGDQGECNHSPSERALVGSWCTPEILEAQKAGYKILQIYEVYNYKESTQYDSETGEGGLFAKQVDTFLKLKAESSGFPAWVVSEEDKENYVREFRERCGVTLDKDKICVNPALRSISKLLLNSFWGKMGQRINQSKTIFIKNTIELAKLISNSSISVTNFNICTCDVLAVEYCKAEGFEEESDITNEVMAAFTTCYARLKLYEAMKTVGADNLIYTDTDSVVFKTKRISDENGVKKYSNYPETGTALGELNSELDEGVFIKQFVTSGPKSYSYRTNHGKECCKFKGVTLNGKNVKKINFEAVKELVYGNKEEIELVPQTKFHRLKFTGEIINVPLVKRLQHTFNKRKILPNLDTVPYGYI